ncbi:hypothetical protein M1615_02600 [Patescibacteria group bacterium]|nr:hypothetical protein [Patescibacteria group bacterium]
MNKGIKKTNILFTLLFLTLFLSVFSFSTFAQTSLFFNQKPIFIQKLTGYQHSADEQLPIDRVTTITVSKGSFGTPTTIYVYKSINSQIQKLIPQGQTPISSYEIIFKNSNNVTVMPKFALKIEVINSYKNTPTYYYPVVNGGIDLGFKKQMAGNARTLSLLPINDNGFIVAINTSAAPGNLTNPSNNATQYNSSILTTLLPTVLILLLIILAIIFLLTGRKRRRTIS